MSVYPGSYKHGASAYDIHRCRCDICLSAKSKITKERKTRLFGKEPPKHGTSGSYSVYGCRCNICVEARRKYHDEYKAKLSGKEPPKHGITGYDIYGCRCQICVSAKNQSHLKRRNNPRIIIQEKERGWTRIGIKNFTYSDFCKKYDEQEGKCLICGKEMKKESKKRSEVATVDHDHLTGKVRSLLCGNCNKMLGSSEPSLLRKGADYLESYRCGGSL